MGTNEQLDNIYEAFCISEKYSERTEDLKFAPKWLLEKLQSKSDYIRLEEEVVQLISLNDKVMFECGFYFAWKLFHQCNSYQK